MVTMETGGIQSSSCTTLGVEVQRYYIPKCSYAPQGQIMKEISIRIMIVHHVIHLSVSPLNTTFFSKFCACLVLKQENAELCGFVAPTGSAPRYADLHSYEESRMKRSPPEARRANCKLIYDSENKQSQNRP